MNGPQPEDEVEDTCRREAMQGCPSTIAERQAPKEEEIMKDRVYQHSFNHAAYGWGIATLVIKYFNTLWVMNIVQNHNSLEEMIHPIILLIKGYPKFWCEILQSYVAFQ